MLKLLNILPNPPEGTLTELAAGVIDFFSLWIARIGFIVFFVGAIKFVLSIKSEDMKDQIKTVLIMVSGCIIMAAVNDLDIFTVTNKDNGDELFNAIFKFIVEWISAVGMVALIFGGISFGFAQKNNDAASKISSIKTMVVGGMIIGLSTLFLSFSF